MSDLIVETCQFCELSIFWDGIGWSDSEAAGADCLGAGTAGNHQPRIPVEDNEALESWLSS